MGLRHFRFPLKVRARKSLTTKLVTFCSLLDMLKASGLTRDAWLLVSRFAPAPNTAGGYEVHLGRRLRVEWTAKCPLRHRTGLNGVHGDLWHFSEARFEAQKKPQLQKNNWWSVRKRWKKTVKTQRNVAILNDLLKVRNEKETFYLFTRLLKETGLY